MHALNIYMLIILWINLNIGAILYKSAVLFLTRERNSFTRNKEKPLFEANSDSSLVNLNH